jgi:hypothetical protein
LTDGLAEALRRGARTKLDMRAKGLTDPMIRYAKDLGIDLTVSTKYWCEQAGLPHHLTRMRTEELLRLDNLNHSRRYSYSDMLKKPRLHKFLYRLWNDGSTDILTWGDPDYVRRFVASMRLGRADGFEIMPLLSLKGGPQDGMVAGWNLFDDPACQPEGCEDSRYWLCDRLFGRIGYDMGEAEEAWMRPMRQKFGAASEPMMAAISTASRLIPLIVGCHMPVHPQLCYWAEFSTGGSLFADNNRNPAIRRAGVTYQSTEPGDAGLFYPIREYAKDYLAGAEDGRYTPWQVAGALAGISRGTEKYLGLAEKAGLPDSSEARGAALDLRMLSSLALYHRHKIAASVALCLHEETGDAEWLGESLASMKLARSHWVRYAELGQKYHSRLTFYSGDYSVCRDGNWKDFYAELDADVARLSQMALGREGAAGRAEPAAGHAEPAQGGGAEPECGETAGRGETEGRGEAAQSGEAAGRDGRCRCLESGSDMRPMCWTDDAPASCRAGEPLKIALFAPIQDAFRGCVSLRYRHTNQLEGKFLSAPMELRDGAWRGEIPAGYIVPEWDLLVYFDAVSPSGDGIQYPGVWHPQHMLPYHIVEVAEARGEAAEAQS